LATAGAGIDQDMAARRHDLVDYLSTAQGIVDSEVVRSLESVPRHLFVPTDYRSLAYADRPLPIGYGQTISQPYIVGLMTQALELQPGDRVLEVGTGSGYQAAVLAELVEQVFTIEIVGALAERSAGVLADLGYENVEVRHGDGYFGWPEEAPFDAIIVTAAPDHVPPPLRAQLADGGRLVIPVGPVGGYQELWLVRRHGDRFDTSSLGGVVFVPLTRETRDD
jgi:protein-L-isoaspartate(D-aspartate) O-methyltransferase